MRRKKKDARKGIMRTLVNDEERRHIEKLADAHGVSVSEWLRSRGMGMPRPGGDLSATDKKLLLKGAR